MRIFYKENTFKKFPNKAYCIQWEWDKPQLFFEFNNKLALDDTGFHFYICWFGLFGVNIYWTRKEDHAGINLGFDLLGLMVENTIYDIRHWDYDNECWQKYGEK